MTPTTDDLAREAERFAAAAGLVPRPVTGVVWGEGSDTVLVVDEAPDAVQHEELAAARAWRRRLDEADLAWLTGPVAHGGRGLSRGHQKAVDAVLDRYETPNDRVLSVGLTIVGPAIAAHGTPRAVAEVLGGIHRGDVMACQLFSEPDAGSDLPSLRTRAERADGGWLINGRKVWSSGAHLSDIGECLVRTDPSGGRHRGLTMLLVDMHAPGVTARPIRQMTGGASFNEVTLDDVFVPDDLVLAEPGAGWAVTMTTLLAERLAVGDGQATAGDDAAERLTALAGHAGPGAVERDRLAGILIADRVNDTFVRLATDRAGGQPGPELSGAKLLYSRQARAIADLAGDLLGPAIAADDGRWGTFAWSRYLTGAPGIRIAGGTDEIQRTTLAERVLGLPKEPAPQPPPDRRTDQP